MAAIEVRRDIPQAERDAMDAADFAGKDRSFPINRPEDVAAAASSLGRAGDDNYGSDELKARIIAIAKRKGPAYVAQLPDAWRDGAEDSDSGSAPSARSGQLASSAQSRAYARAAEMRADPVTGRTIAAMRGRR
jgi:hypothetical protein